MPIKELFKHWTYSVFAPGTLFSLKYRAFKELLRYDSACLDLIADIEEIYYGGDQADWARMAWICNRLRTLVARLVEHLLVLSPSRHMDLPEYLKKIDFYIQMGLDTPDADPSPPYTLGLDRAADLPALTGGKAANLALAAAETNVPVPPGFVITANAFNYILETNFLRPDLDKILRRVSLSAPGQLPGLCAKMQQMVMSADIPEVIVSEIQKALDALPWKGALALRSSAVSEDGDISFAGQYKTCLDVEPKDLIRAYKQVLAAKYGQEAVSYRVLNGLADQETPMAVLVMPSIAAAASGVIYTRDEDRSQCLSGLLALYAVPGQGSALVEGRARPDIYCFSRDPVPEQVQCPEAPRSSLDPDTAKRLASFALELEELFSGPQDVEWLLDTRGRPYIVQSRPLQADRPSDERPPPRNDKAEVLIWGATRAAAGIDSGPVFQLRDEEHLESVPKGCVLVVENLSPCLSAAAGRIKAVVSVTGSRASHFASVAREMGLPVLVGAQNAFEVLRQGLVVTVDANRKTVLAGRAPALGSARAARQASNPALDRLGRIMGRVAQLSLTDPAAEDFSPQGCRSLHDVVRYVHENAVLEMFSLVGRSGRGMGRAKRLKSGLPIVIYILDIDQGLFEAAAKKAVVSADDIKSAPMWALWAGLNSKDNEWPKDLLHVDWQEFDKISAGLFKFDSRLLASYAVLAKDYMHLMVRFGYHLSVVDSLCGQNAQNNYVKFRFKGGGGGLDQRLLRLRFIQGVLETRGFRVLTKGDMLDALLSRTEANTILKALTFLGRVLAKTRLMDLGLGSEAEVEELVSRFLRQCEEAEAEPPET
ncbi:MAG: hypothetical protein JW718_06090 [Desulfovibrionaceae bacterium]|nr:hypothetical protein [Desulfovibrionaceae bacterium]